VLSLLYASARRVRRTHGAKQSERPCSPLLLKIAPREMKHALKTHVPVCLYVLHRICILWLHHVQYCTNILSNYTDHPQVHTYWIHRIKNFFTVQDVWGTCACPKKQSLPWKFSLYWIYFSHSVFLNNLRLPWKTELPWNFSAWGGLLLPRSPASYAYGFRLCTVWTLITPQNCFFTRWQGNVKS